MRKRVYRSRRGMRPRNIILNLYSKLMRQFSNKRRVKRVLRNKRIIQLAIAAPNILQLSINKINDLADLRKLSVHVLTWKR